MSGILYVLSGLAVMIGAALLAFGIPVKEFGVGNALIISGTVSLCTGLMIFALAAVLAQLGRLSDMLAARPVSRDARPATPFERPGFAAATGGEQPRIPFPQRPGKPAAAPLPDAASTLAPTLATTLAPPMAAATPLAPDADGPAAERTHFAPMLRNPTLAASTDEPRGVSAMAESSAEPPRDPAPPDFHALAKDLPADIPLDDTPEGMLSASDAEAEVPAAERAEPEPFIPPPPIDAPRKAPVTPPPMPERSAFDSMWPAEPRFPRRTPAAEPSVPVEPAFPRAFVEDAVDNARREWEPAPAFEPDGPEPEPAVADAADAAPEADVAKPAVLKSGVVDGMAYTLYVDGSIEAELPDGTLRFASIHELRRHLDLPPQ